MCIYSLVIHLVEVSNHTKTDIAPSYYVPCCLLCTMLLIMYHVAYYHVAYYISCCLLCTMLLIMYHVVYYVPYPVLLIMSHVVVCDHDYSMREETFICWINYVWYVHLVGSWLRVSGTSFSGSLHLILLLHRKMVSNAKLEPCQRKWLKKHFQLIFFACQIGAL